MQAQSGHWTIREISCWAADKLGWQHYQFDIKTVSHGTLQVSESGKSMIARRSDCVQAVLVHLKSHHLHLHSSL